MIQSPDVPYSTLATSFTPRTKYSIWITIFIVNLIVVGLTAGEWALAKPYQLYPYAEPGASTLAPFVGNILADVLAIHAFTILTLTKYKTSPSSHSNSVPPIYNSAYLNIIISITILLPSYIIQISFYLIIQISVLSPNMSYFTCNLEAGLLDECRKYEGFTRVANILVPGLVVIGFILTVIDFGYNMVFYRRLRRERKDARIMAVLRRVSGV